MKRLAWVLAALCGVLIAATSYGLDVDARALNLARSVLRLVGVML